MRKGRITRKTSHVQISSCISNSANFNKTSHMQISSGTTNSANFDKAVCFFVSELIVQQKKNEINFPLCYFFWHQIILGIAKFFFAINFVL